MAAEFEAPSAPRGPRSHDIGPGGVVVVAVEADDVRIRGVDGTEARVVAPADGAGIETLAEPGRFTVRTAGVPQGVFLGIRIGSHGFGVHVSGTIELEVPRDARVEVRSAAGDVALRDVRGGASAKTATGDVSIKRAAGRISVNVASGDVAVTATEPISLDVHSVSGDVRARAPRFEHVAIETVSGDAELAGSFGTAVGHAVSTVSGDVEVALAGGLTVEVRTVSGDVECDHPDRREGNGRRRPLVIGDGAAHLAVRSMSGGVRIRAGRTPAENDPGRAKPDHADDAAGVRFGFAAAPPLPPIPPRPPIAPLPPLPQIAPLPPMPESSPPPASTEATHVAPAASPGSDPSADPAAAPDPAAASDPAMLGILEALARGEIDVSEAERRLAGTPDPGTPDPVAPSPAAGSNAVPGAEREQRDG